MRDVAWDVAPIPYHKPSPHLTPLQVGNTHLDGLSQVHVDSHENTRTHTHNCDQECSVGWHLYGSVFFDSRSPCCKLKPKVIKPN